jgi:hypothetical protein
MPLSSKLLSQASSGVSAVIHCTEAGQDGYEANQTQDLSA